MNDTIIFIVLAGLALIFKWLTSQGEKTESPPPDEQAPPRPPPQSEEERMRRFMDALGMPAGTQPPPPVRQRRVVTPLPPAQRPKVKRSLVQPLPPIVTTPPEMELPLLPIAEAEEVAVEVPRPAPVLVAAAPLPACAVAPVRALSSQSLGKILRSPASIRRAIVLREVLGPPRGLEPFHQIQGS